MKRLLLILVVAIIASPLPAQTGFSYLSRLPGVPSDVCSMRGEQKQQYMDNLNALLKEMENEITSKKKVIEKDVENSRPQIEKKIAEDYGLSNSDVQKLKNKKMSKDEKKAMIDKMLKEKGLSLKEVENLKKMSKEGKQQWAEGYSTQQMANNTGNQDGTQSDEQIKMQKEMEKNQKLNDLMKEQKLITDRIHASDNKFINQMMELDKEDSVATKILDEQVKPLRKRLNDVPGPSEDEAKSIMREIVLHEKVYCNKLSPLFMKILGDALIDLNKFMPDYGRLQEITDELNKTLLKTDKNFSSPGLMQMDAVNSFAHQLLNVFKYSVYSYPDEESQQE